VLSQTGITASSFVLGQMNHAISSDQMVAEVVSQEISAVSSHPLVFEGHRVLIESDHLHRSFGVSDKTANRSLSDSTRRPGHHNREHCHTMPA
jgi:hypothetical protein